MQTDNVIDHIVNWLKNYALTARSRGFVIGISGGLDSAVASILCARTGMDVLCLEMPIHQAATHISRGQEHIAQLKDNFINVSNQVVDLTSVFDTFASEVSSDGNPAIVDMALANTRARLRMTTLYYYAGLHGLLVAGTGNKIEDFGVGFYTKYGDGGVDLSPLADLTKTEVHTLAEALGVSSAILTAAPSDGLFGDDRSDEDQIGATYPELEWAMEMKENGHIPDDFNGRQKEVFELYDRLNRNNQHKMRPIPICKIPDNLKESVA